MAARSLAGEALESFRHLHLFRRYFFPAVEIDFVEGLFPLIRFLEDLRRLRVPLRRLRVPLRRRRRFVIAVLENLFATLLRSRFVIPFQRLTSEMSFFLEIDLILRFLAVAKSHFFPSFPRERVFGRAVDAEAERTRRRTRRAIFSQERVSSERVGCQLFWKVNPPLYHR